MAAEDGRPTAMLIVTTLSQPGTARVSATDDVGTQIARTSLARSLPELLDLVTTWWSAYWSDDQPSGTERDVTPPWRGADEEAR